MRSKSSLFLTEMILSILIFAIASSICVQIFVKAHQISQNSEARNHAQNLSASMVELLSASEIKESDIFRVFPSASIENDSITAFYDKSWKMCDSREYAFILKVHFNENSMEYSSGKLLSLTGNCQGIISVSRKNGELIYDLPFFFHIPKEWEKEGNAS